MIIHENSLFSSILSKGTYKSNTHHYSKQITRIVLTKKDIGVEYLPVVEARLVFPCCCCTPPAIPPESTSTHHYSILNHISQHSNRNGDNIRFSFTIIFTFTLRLLSFRILVH